MFFLALSQFGRLPLLSMNPSSWMQSLFSISTA